MSEADLPAVVRLSDALRRSPRLDDWQRLHALGEGVVVERDEDMLACGLLFRWSPHQASIGHVLGVPGPDGEGAGRAVLDALLQRLDGCSVGMLIDIASVSDAQQRGFIPVGRITQREGIARSMLPLALPLGTRMRPMGAHELPAIRSLDEAANGLRREALLSSVLDEAASVVVLDIDGVAQGFAVLRRFGRGHRIGPVVAPQRLGAQALIGHLIGLQAGRFTRIDLQDEDDPLGRWLEGSGLDPRRLRMRMRRGPQASSAGARLYAVADSAAV